MEAAVAILQERVSELALQRDTLQARSWLAAACVQQCDALLELGRVVAWGDALAQGSARGGAAATAPAASPTAAAGAGPAAADGLAGLGLAPAAGSAGGRPQAADACEWGGALGAATPLLQGVRRSHQLAQGGARLSGALPPLPPLGWQPAAAAER